MTPILKVITEYCDVYVDDVRLTELKETNKAEYANTMWNYLRNAIPLFKHPMEMPQYLKYVEPIFDSVLYKTEQRYIQPFTINLGRNYKGYEICACNIRVKNKCGDTYLIPTEITYNEKTGDITINVSGDNPIEINTEFAFDFYTDGYFEKCLSTQIMSILGKCFNVIWQGRFNSDWLSMVSKVEDKSFFEQNRANKMNADTTRLFQLMNLLMIDMGTYEKMCYVNKVVPHSKRIQII